MNNIIVARKEIQMILLNFLKELEEIITQTGKNIMNITMEIREKKKSINNVLG